MSRRMLPCADVTGSDHGLAGADDGAGEVVALVQRRLHVVRELDHHDVGRRLAELREAPGINEAQEGMSS